VSFLDSISSISFGAFGVNNVRYERCLFLIFCRSIPFDRRYVSGSGSLSPSPSWIGKEAGADKPHAMSAGIPPLSLFDESLLGRSSRECITYWVSPRQEWSATGKALADGLETEEWKGIRWWVRQCGVSQLGLEHWENGRRDARRRC